MGLNDTITDGIQNFEVIVVGVLMFVLVSFFAYETFEWLYNSLLAVNAAWWIWGMFAIAFGSVLLKEGEEVIAFGFLGSFIAGYIALTTTDYLGLGVIIASWMLFAVYKTRSS